MEVLGEILLRRATLITKKVLLLISTRKAEISALLKML